MIYLLDHRDSFTWNIVHLLEEFEPVQVVDALAHQPYPQPQATDFVVLSPGPGSPEDYPRSLEWYRQLPSSTPVFGICLGFQMMAYEAGAEIIRMPEVLHGVCTTLNAHSDDFLHRGVPLPIEVGRYHALTIRENENLARMYEVTAVDSTNGLPLAIEHLTLPRVGVQYHPDSFLTKYGFQIVQNIYTELGRWR